MTSHVENLDIFSLKMKSKVPIATGTENFEHFQNHQKNTVFWYQITDSTKKVVEKTTFFTPTHCWSGGIFCHFSSKIDFFENFVLKFTLLLKKFFFHIFLWNFFPWKFLLQRGHLFLLFSTFFLKNVFTIDGGHFFFGFSKQKIQFEHPYGRGGSKRSFLKTWLLDY